MATATLRVPATSGAGLIVTARRHQQKRAAHCDDCDGTGKKPWDGSGSIPFDAENRPKCKRCKGKGKHAWSTDHDDGHTDGELAWAAICWAAPTEVYRVRGAGDPAYSFVDPWPWDRRFDKRPYGRRATREERIDLLAKAGALLAAEIDRLQRSEEADA